MAELEACRQWRLAGVAVGEPELIEETPYVVALVKKYAVWSPKELKPQILFGEAKVSHSKLTHKSVFDVVHAYCMVAAYDHIVDIEYDKNELAI